MPNTRFDESTKAKAVRLVREHAGDYDSEWAAMCAISSRLGIGGFIRRTVSIALADDASSEVRDGPHVRVVAALLVLVVVERCGNWSTELLVPCRAGSYNVRSSPRSRRYHCYE
jgi:hypothetical protein